MHSAVLSNRLFLGIVAFGVSFGISLVPNWDYSKAFVTGIITLIATYAAAFCVDRRRKNYEMLILNSLRKKIKELEELKSRISREIHQIEEHRSLLYTESKHLQNKVTESRNQRDNIQRELSTFAGQKKQLETELTVLSTEIHSLDKNKAELNNSVSMLTAEKRRLELNCNVSRSEINQLQHQISGLLQEKEEIENHITLLGRLKPQIEEKLYELRIELQNLEVEFNHKNQSLLNKTTNKENIESNLSDLQTNIGEQQAELQRLQAQVFLLQEERDLLQSQVWELLQQLETLNPEPLPEKSHEENLEFFPFAELIETLETQDTKADIYETLPEEWGHFLEQLPNHEIQIIKALLMPENTQATIKKIAEANITMPNLLIDSINGKANDTLGELIINPSVEPPEIYQEYINNVKKMLDTYEHHI
ncbi:MAG: tellurite resistance TerB C-terminal domain-containing protein [Aulosira sp. DedQUE10]|nr:tellurite resistance TerB C-terminal domain-containing protein [Aulosira sp. DedQUE10]